LISPRRRQLLGLGMGLSLAALGTTRCVHARSEAGATSLTIERRWPTGNQRLFPVSRLDQAVLYAGESTLGLIDPTATQALWSVSHELPEGATFRPRTQAGIAVCAGRREIAAWRPGQNAPLWRYPARVQIGTPLLHEGAVYFGDGHELVALDLESGAPRWRFAAVADTKISYAPTAVGDSVFVGPGDGRLYALATTDGKPRWVVNRIRDWQYLRQLHLSGNVLVAGGYQEKLHGIDIANGKALWSFNAGNFINSHHVADGVAYLWSPMGWLYAIDARSGAMRWRHRTNDYSGGSYNWGPLMAELVTQDQRLYALDLNNVLHILDTTQGEESARLSLPEPVRPFVLPLDARRALFGADNGDLLLATI
jgi:outer membrane protein assembly factor BamB